MGEQRLKRKVGPLLGSSRFRFVEASEPSVPLTSERMSLAVRERAALAACSSAKSLYAGGYVSMPIRETALGFRRRDIAASVEFCLVARAVDLGVGVANVSGNAFTSNVGAGLFAARKCDHLERHFGLLLCTQSASKTPI
jgi:hypothetical protein